MSFDTRFINIPFDVIKRKDLNHSDLLVFGIVYGFPDGECHCSNEYLATVLRVSVRTIQRHISKMVDLKVLFSRPVYGSEGQKGRILRVHSKYKFNK